MAALWRGASAGGGIHGEAGQLVAVTDGAEGLVSKKDSMSPRERLEAVFAGKQPDHTPILGGWIACPDHIARLAQVDLETYWRDPVAASIAAYRRLGSDGLIDLFVPRRRDDFRCVDADTYVGAHNGLSLEQCLDQIDRMPSATDVEAAFDFEAEYARFAARLTDRRRKCGQMLWMPAQWGAGAKASWYSDFGYENYFCVIALYPDRARKLMEVGGAMGHCQARLVAKAIEDELYPRACLLGEDICTQRGPMVSPAFLAEHYAPALRHSLKPLLDVGCRCVWHCDGDVRAILDMLLECGVGGLQGFQPECGMTIDYVASKRATDGGRLLIFGPLSVTTELPVCTPEQVKAKVRRAVEVCREQADLVVFTANTINPDVPLENIVAMHEAVREG